MPPAKQPTKHRKERRQCRQCSKTYSCSAALSRHKKKHHPEAAQQSELQEATPWTWASRNLIRASSSLAFSNAAHPSTAGLSTPPSIAGPSTPGLSANVCSAGAYDPALLGFGQPSDWMNPPTHNPAPHQLNPPANNSAPDQPNPWANTLAPAQPYPPANNHAPDQTDNPADLGNHFDLNFG
ncbi:hypothetical protein FRC05_003031 [Tulasnella sp. 425]|nr:hypothetical protein FRC05_003031 [Tulasnella sp. 425]